MDPFADRVSKTERRHLKHGIADVETKHSVQRKQERRHQSTRPISVCVGDRRVVVTHVPKTRSQKKQPMPNDMGVISETVETTLSAGRLIVRRGCNVQPLRVPGISVHVEQSGSKTLCTIFGRKEDDVMRTLSRLNCSDRYAFEKLMTKKIFSERMDIAREVASYLAPDRRVVCCKKYKRDDNNMYLLKVHNGVSMLDGSENEIALFDSIKPALAAFCQTGCIPGWAAWRLLGRKRTAIQRCAFLDGLVGSREAYRITKSSKPIITQSRNPL